METWTLVMDDNERVNIPIEYSPLVLHCSDMEEDDDEDDGINITINPLNSTNSLVSDDEMSKINNVIDTEMYNSREIDDLAIKNELNALVAQSINPKTSKCITVKFQNQIILIPNTTPISSRLASLFWPYPKYYTEMRLPSQQEFNRNIEECRKSGRYWSNTYPNDLDFTETIGIFAAKYKKNVISMDASSIATTATTTNNTSNNQQNDEGFKQCLSGVYQYCDFALIIIKNGLVVDYAIHGFRSNIAECIERHQPKKIFYNANVGDALDVFLHYPYQPFYECMSNRMQAVKIYRLPENFNPISFCERSDIYCALCSALKDFRGMLFRVPQQKLQYDLTTLASKATTTTTTTTSPIMTKITTSSPMTGKRSMVKRSNRRLNLGRNQYGQPIHNAFRIRLHKAEKNPTRFRPYLRKNRKICSV